MNKQELSTHIKQSVQNVDEILKGFELPLDLPDYSPEQVTAIEEVTKLVETKQAKTFKEAVGLYRKPERENQLKEIAFRYSIPESDLPQILSEMQYKLETLTDAQVDEFQTLCQQLQNGMSLEIAVQSALNNAKTETKSKATAKAKKNSQPAQDAAAEQQPSVESTAITQAKDNPMPELAVKGVESVPVDAREQIDAVAKAVGPRAVPDFVEVVTDEASAVEQGIREYARQALLKAITENPRPQGTPEDAVALFEKKLAEKRAQRYGN